MEFTPPDFDEVEYMRKEVETAKAGLVTVAWAFVVAFISYALTLFAGGSGATLGGFIGILGLYGLRYLYPLARLDTSKFDWKAWAGNGAIHLFAWLAFWVLLLNPPFVDVSPPVIGPVHLVDVPGVNPNTTFENGASLQVDSAVERVTFEVTVSDNVRVARVEISVANQEAVEMTHSGGATWTHTVDLPGTVNEIRVQAFDGANRGSVPFRMTITAG